MRNFTVFLFLFLFTTIGFSQEKSVVKGTIVNDLSFLPLDDVNVINITQVKGTISKRDGNFSIEANLNDSIHFSSPGYTPMKLKVTNDWLNNETLKVYLSEQSTVMEEIFIKKFDLTGILEVDTKLIELNERMRFDFYRRNQNPYYSTAIGSFYSPVDAIYNLFKGKSNKLAKIDQIKEDTNMLVLMQNKYDREIVCGLLEITREDITKTLQDCNYSDNFIYTASDFQIYQALNDCYSTSKVMVSKENKASL